MNTRGPINCTPDNIIVEPRSPTFRIIKRLLDLDQKHPGILHPDLLDFLDVLEAGAQKYAVNNWLEPNGKRASHKDNHDSMSHHFSESYCGILKDKDSGLNPKLHLACRALMGYVRQKNGIIHVEDRND